MFRVYYERVLQTNNMYQVTVPLLEQSMYVSRGVLVSRIGMHPSTEVGCQDLSINEIIHLGFVFPMRKRLAI